MSDAFFTPGELAVLREHGVVIFAERVIFDARAPMSEDQIAAVQAVCAGPLPPPLLALWRETAGGRLDYDLTLRMNGNEEAVHWSELFWNGSDGYHDLAGWIAHEQALAEEAARTNSRPWDGKLAVLPFGGFEHSDRVYAVVDPHAQDYGHILAWKQGLPPAWAHAMHEDGLAAVATDLHGAFRTLHLDEDPLEPAGDSFSGQGLIDYLDERHESHGLDIELMDKVVEFYRRAMANWRTPLAAGTIARYTRLAHIALRHAIATDDAELIARLAAAGTDFDAPLQGDAIATDLAVSHGAYAAAEALLEAGAKVAPEVLDQIDRAISPELTAALLARGALPSATAMAQCVACGAPASARLIAQALANKGHDVPAAYDTARSDLINDLESHLAAVRSGSRTHYLGAEGLAKRMVHLGSFEL